MQRELLEPNIDADVRVYAVWFAMLGGDARSAWDSELLPDARVHHYWDDDRLVGTWFAEEVEGFEGVVWDAYYLFDASARWDESPPQAISKGSNVIDYREQLEATLLPLWSP